MSMSSPFRPPIRARPNSIVHPRLTAFQAVVGARIFAQNRPSLKRPGTALQLQESDTPVLRDGEVRESTKEIRPGRERLIPR